MKNLFLFSLICSIILFCSCNKNDAILQNQSIKESSVAPSLVAPPDGKNKDEAGCVVKNDEPPMTKCFESVGSTCSTIHTCESVLSMRMSGKYTEAELQQSERLGRAAQLPK